jgi:hypothetical protein
MAAMALGGAAVVVLYLFGLWLALIAGTALLARRLPAEQEDGGQG